MTIQKRMIPELLSGGIVVVGLGLIGGSIVRSLREYSAEFRICAVDIKPEPIERALKDQMIEDG